MIMKEHFFNGASLAAYPFADKNTLYNYRRIIIIEVAKSIGYDADYIEFLKEENKKRKWGTNMSKIITIANQKGGIAKTTTSLALSIGLKEKGYKTLLVDFDPQCNATDNMRAETKDQATLYDILCAEYPAADAIQQTPLGEIIACDKLLSSADRRLADTGYEYIFSEAIESIKDKYDFIILDTPPAFGALMLNALYASDGVIVPINSDRFALSGLAELNNTINKVRKYGHKDLKIYGLLLCKYNPRLRKSKLLDESISDICKQLNTKVFNTYIRDSVEISNAQITKDSPYSKKSNASEDYKLFIEELCEVI